MFSLKVYPSPENFTQLLFAMVVTFYKSATVEGFGLLPRHFWPLANPFLAFGQGLELWVVNPSIAHDAIHLCLIARHID